MIRLSRGKRVPFKNKTPFRNFIITKKRLHSFLVLNIVISYATDGYRKTLNAISKLPFFKLMFAWIGSLIVWTTTRRRQNFLFFLRKFLYDQKKRSVLCINVKFSVDIHYKILFH